jgi:hypothetical protein
MTAWIAFIIGLFIGGAVGVWTMCLMILCGQADRKDRKG